MSSADTTSRSDSEAAPTSSSWFPLGMKEGFSQWLCKVPAATAEHKVLSYIPYLQEAPTQRQTGNTASLPDDSTGAVDSLQAPDLSQQGEETVNSANDPYGPRRWRSRMVELSGRGRALNEFSVERVGEQTEQNLVILHGYGAGLGFFYKNFEPLSRAQGWHLYALDLLGMGRSTRPSFKIKAKNREEAISEAEDWFIDALEEWRVKQKIDRLTLMGHSMGGYMAVAYALKYPGRLNKLILVSPVGIPEDPYAVNESLPEPSDSTLANEFTQDQNEITTPERKANGNKPIINAGTATPQSDPAPRRHLPKIISYLWDANVSPFSIIRWAGPMGPRLVSGWTSRRFSHLPAPEAAALHDYSYSIFRLRGSGEYALTYILAPGAFARSPLIRRIQGVGRQVIRPSSTEALQPTPELSPSLSGPESAASSASETSASSQPQRENGIPVVLMYGDHDWMDVAGGFAAKEKIEEEKRRVLANASPEQRKSDNGSAKVVIVKQAGHHLYLDGYEEFNQIILKEMADVQQREARKEL